MARAGKGTARFARNLELYAARRAEREMREEQEQEEIEAPTRIGKLKSATDIMRYQARLLRRVEARQVDVNRGYRLACLAAMLLKSWEMSALEQQVNALEDQAKAWKQAQNDRASAYQADAQGEKPQQSDVAAPTVNTLDNTEGGKQVDQDKPEVNDGVL